MKPKVIDYVKDEIAYYFPKDRAKCLPGYKLVSYRWLYSDDGKEVRGKSSLFVQNGIKGILKLFNHWNSDRRWFYYL